MKYDVGTLIDFNPSRSKRRYVLELGQIIATDIYNEEYDSEMYEVYIFAENRIYSYRDEELEEWLKQKRIAIHQNPSFTK